MGPGDTTARSRLSGRRSMTLSDNMRGALLMMLSMAAFTLNDTFLKTLSGELPWNQAVLLRGVLTSAFLLAFGLSRREIRFILPRRDWGVIALRVWGEVLATIFFLIALFNMPIANVTAILQSLPLAITLAGALFLGERVGWRRYVAIAVGFAGVLMIVRPGGADFDRFAVYAVISVFFVVVRDLSTRRLSRAVPSVTVAFLSASAVTALGGAVTLAVGWHPVTPGHMGAITGASGFIVVGYLASIMTMRVGEIAVVAPFRYTGILWAILLGMAVFGEVPDGWTIAGTAIVVGMGLYTFHRERQLDERRRPVRVRS
jgi:drug/metabolite transporter (DMT)-like permease